jgi:hypothetical protein
VNDPGKAPAATSMVMHDPGPATDNFAFNFGGFGHSVGADFHPAWDSSQPGHPTFASSQVAWNGAHDEGLGASMGGEGHDSFTLTGILKAHLHAADFHFV